MKRIYINQKLASKLVLSYYESDCVAKEVTLSAATFLGDEFNAFDREHQEFFMSCVGKRLELELDFCGWWNVVRVY